MANSTIRIWFTDFWKNFDPSDNWFYHFLSTHFQVELDERSPEVLIYSKFGNRFRDYNCIRVFFTGENIRPNFWECDYALSFDYLDRNNQQRFPLYGIYTPPEPEALLSPKMPFEQMRQQKKHFCCFVVSAATNQHRIDFFQQLSAKMFVHSGGKLLNNIGGPVADKLDFIKDFRYIIAFENSSYPGYTTEKIYQPMFTNTIPIYWGNELIGRDFNTRSFINVHDYPNNEAVIDHLMELERDENKYRALYEQPWFNNNRVNEFINRENIRRFFETVFTTPIPNPVAQSVFRKNAGLLQRRLRIYKKILFKS